MNFTETTAIAMLKAGKQPGEIAYATGLSVQWIELKARGMGKRPMMRGVINGK